MAGKKRFKPTHERIEVTPRPVSPILPGPLRGLNPGKYLIRDDVQHPVEPANDGDDGDDGNSVTNPPLTKHATRASRGLGKDVSYDMKYHPMDRVTRPNSAATRRQSKSASLAMSEPEDDSSVTMNTDEDLSGDSSHDDLSENSQNEDDSGTRLQPIMIQPRRPDPKACRHSARDAARKPINYSKKYHPQDHGIPGYRSRPIFTQSNQEDSVALTNSKKRAPLSSDEIDADEDDEIVPTHTARSQPRKKLKSLSNEPPLRIKKKRSRQATAKAKHKAASKSAMSAKRNKEIDALVDMAIAGSKATETINFPSNHDSDDESSPELADDGYDGSMPDLPRMLSREDSTAGMPHPLLEACTQVSNLPDTDASDTVANEETVESRDSSLATIDTSATTNESPTPATTCHGANHGDEVPFPLPKYVVDLVRLELGPHAAMTSTAVVRTMFDGPSTGTLPKLAIWKPYLEYPLSHPATPNNISAGPSSPKDTALSVQAKIGIDVVDQNDMVNEQTNLKPRPADDRPDLEYSLLCTPKQLERSTRSPTSQNQTSSVAGDEDPENEQPQDNAGDEDPHEMYTPLASEFEDAMAVTEGSTVRSSDPINEFDVYGMSQAETTTAQRPAKPKSAATRRSQLISARPALVYDGSDEA
ncbi:hypothetical protein CERZMDRAFT_87333 [Cercospora zeae-maydis SCOH1-5]|uniref:Uncharacterized protein n=1 Tax=Cercospora zeae-maydis SCOH1-5 TaxID=717836 RepID=A0A6A6F6H5_9PEZI|nr:hypothetical protein CERZMDRAFT_87333 [Cercospora zeae-maydis SCOH1-5]